MGLALYTKKRNFKGTPEPAAKTKTTKSRLIFVVQRHKASHLHYDLRLEMDGVLKSWAVPKGPSLNPQDKRLAMMVEDHPYSYRTFEGIIPEGNYGAGIVEIWDSGYLTDTDDSPEAEKKLKAGLKAGNLKFKLRGKKLKGEFALVKLKGKQDNAWLLIKHKDEFAVNTSYNSEEETAKNSPINKWLAKHKKPAKTAIKAVKEKTEAQKKRSRKLPGESKKLNNYIKPMLAKESENVFSDEEWVYEVKWDGYRAIAEVSKDEVLMYSRNGNTFNASYPQLVEALKEMKINAVLDGEVVVVDEDGNPKFQLLQFYESDPDHPILYYVFDLLELNGKNTCELTLLERKELLKKLLGKHPVIRYSEHVEKDGEDFFKVAAERDLEGIMAKRADSAYQPGVRTTNWLKIKNHHSQEAIIAGFTEPTGSRKFFGALVLGIKEGKHLKYVGHTGSGFTHNELKKLYALLKPKITKASPFLQEVQTNMPVTWVKPELVCEIKYTELTREGIMRHPIFLRLRDDKQTKDVTMKAASKVTVRKAVKKTASKKTAPSKGAGKKAAAEPGESLRFGSIEVPLTNQTKIYWPKEKITKGDLIRYYQNICPYILPYLKGRPQSLYRSPNGITKPGFFHKDAGDEAPEWVESVKLFSESTKKDVDYIVCNNAATLAYLNNLGCIELNPWHSTVKALNKPDYLVIDLDPSSKNTFEQVVETAQAVKEVLDRAGADCYCKTSGATGLHVYIPTQKKYTYDQVKDFAELICILTNELLPSTTTLERNLKKRGNSKIYLDHLQNRRGQTIASAYSLRPKEGATVSTPLLWKEVKKGLSPKDFTLFNILKRLEKTGDLFDGVLGKGIDLRKCLKNLG